MAALSFWLAGCGSGGVELLSYKDPYFPEPYRFQPQECVYRIDPTGDIHVAGRCVEEIDGGQTTQYLHIHIFWKPLPGKTHAEASTTDALLRYVVATDAGVASYRGTGFVFPKKKRGDRLEVTIESGRLRLESSSGSLGDFLGNTRLTGELMAEHEPAMTANFLREAELLAAR